MSGIWETLSKAAVVTWLIVLVSGSILAIVSGIVEYRELKNGKTETEKDSLEPLVTETTERGIRDEVFGVKSLCGGVRDHGIRAGV